jgi:hypothetical protein
VLRSPPILCWHNGYIFTDEIQLECGAVCNGTLFHLCCLSLSSTDVRGMAESDLSWTKRLEPQQSRDVTKERVDVGGETLNRSRTTA